MKLLALVAVAGYLLVSAAEANKVRVVVANPWHQRPAWCPQRLLLQTAPHSPAGQAFVGVPEEPQGEGGEGRGGERPVQPPWDPEIPGLGGAERVLGEFPEFASLCSGAEEVNRIPPLFRSVKHYRPTTRHRFLSLRVAPSPETLPIIPYLVLGADL